ncbi:MAG TPA: S49 family peptidase, partial [Gemmatales bacterium]|nr:S49 family peptidase [Gemmatales bacterium]
MSMPPTSPSGPVPAGAAPTGPVAVYLLPPPPPPGILSRAFQWFMRGFFLLSLLLNVLLLNFLASELDADATVPELHVQGDRWEKHKIAIVRVEGAIVEGFTSFAHQQIRRAAQDDQVRAVVLAINSPGGTVTASDELHQAVKRLRAGEFPEQKAPKPVVVAMESIAASGGYYIAAPADHIVAQPTTLTGSIGVYAQLFDVSELAAKHGVGLTMLKKGELKGSGSPFHKMRPEEELEFNELLEHSYQRFMGVIVEGRNRANAAPRLRHGLRDEITLETLTEPRQRYTRRLADGGGWIAPQALEFGLIDQIGYQQDALAVAAQLIDRPLSDCRGVRYRRSTTFGDSLLGLSSAPPPATLRL